MIGGARPLAALAVLCTLHMEANAQERGHTARGVLRLTPALPARVSLPAGRFVMGSLPSEMKAAIALCAREPAGAQCPRYQALFRREGFAHSVSLSPFQIDRTEVTVAAYRTCVRAGRCAPPQFLPGDPRFDRPELPVTHVRYDDAAAYCAFRGARLPTAAEWEYAARGSESRRFPWGNAAHPSACNHGRLDDSDEDGGDGYVYLAPAGAMPGCVTPEGVHDLAGNAAEWVSDWLQLNDAQLSYPQEPAHDPQGPASGSYRLVKGGSYLTALPWLRGAALGPVDDDAVSPEIGFRCVVPGPRRAPLPPLTVPPQPDDGDAEE